MNDSRQFPVRKQPVHGVKFVDGQPTIVYVTVCTKHRTCWLNDDQVHQRLIDAWKDAALWLVGRYVIMPDHIHLFAGATESDISLDRWVKYWKASFSKLHPNRRQRWQAGHWDTRMRNQEQLAQKWHYVQQNPVRHGLVAEATDWPFQGELNILPWR